VIARLVRSLVARYPVGVDVSKALRLPPWLEATLSHDFVAYPLHAGLGSGFNLVQAPPELAGMEWLKAASHARSARGLRRVINGLAASRRRAPSANFDARVTAALVRRVTCTGSDVIMRRKQILALDRAGLTIADAQAWSDASDEGFVCLLHPDGRCPTTPPVLHRDAAHP
jgi:hypothetical protein